MKFPMIEIPPGFDSLWLTRFFFLSWRVLGCTLDDVICDDLVEL